MTESALPSSPSAETVPADRVAHAMRLGFWALMIDMGVTLLIQSFTWLSKSLPHETLERWLRVTWVINSLVIVGSVSVFAFLSLRLASASTGAHRRLASIAVALFASRGLLTTFSTAISIAELRLPQTLSTLLSFLAYALFYGSWALLFVALARKAKDWGFRLPLLLLGATLLCSVSSLAITLYWRSRLKLPFEEWPGLWLTYLRLGLSYSATLGLAGVWFIIRSRLLRAREAAQPELARVSSPEWRAASNGLAFYRNALLWRIGVTLLGIPLLLLAADSGDQGLTQGLLKLITLATLACGIASLVGLYGYTRIPESSGAREHAQTALWTGISGGLFDVWAVTLVFRLSGDSVSAAFSYMRQAPWAEAGAQSAGLVALLFLVASFHRAASALSAAELASRASSVGWLLGIAGFASMGIKLAATTLSGASELLFLAIPVVAALLVGVVSFVSLVGVLVRTMEVGPPQAAEPSLGTTESPSRP